MPNLNHNENKFSGKIKKSHPPTPTHTSFPAVQIDRQHVLDSNKRVLGLHLSRQIEISTQHLDESSLNHGSRGMPTLVAPPYIYFFSPNLDSLPNAPSLLSYFNLTFSLTF